MMLVDENEACSQFKLNERIKLILQQINIHLC